MPARPNRAEKKKPAKSEPRSKKSTKASSKPGTLAGKKLPQVPVKAS